MVQLNLIISALADFSFFFLVVGCEQLERRKQEDELKRVRQQEEHFERVKVK